MAKKCLAFFDRSGTGHLTGLSSAFKASMGGMVVNDGAQGQLFWSNMQATAGSPHGSGTIANAAIDAAFNAVKTYNATSPTIPWRVKLRPSAGIAQPTWLKNLHGTGSFGALLSNGTDTMVGFWTADFEAVWAQFMLTLAAYVPADGLGYTLDTHPNLGEVACGASMTTFAEPMLQSGWTYAQLGFANFAAFATVGEPALEASLKDTLAAFPNTPVSLACNPYGNSDVAFTSSAIGYLIKSVASGGAGGVTPMGVVENNSLRANLANNSIPSAGSRVVAPTTARDPNTGAVWCDNGTFSDGHGGQYTTTYTTMAKTGQGAAASALGGAGYPIANPSPLCIQTSTYGGMGGTTVSLENTLDYAVWLGARMVELPSGFDGALTAPQLAAYVPGLLANDPTASFPPSGAGNLHLGATGAATVQAAATGSGHLTLVGAATCSATAVSASGSGYLAMAGAATFSGAFAATGTGFLALAGAATPPSPSTQALQVFWNAGEWWLAPPPFPPGTVPWLAARDAANEGGT